MKFSKALLIGVAAFSMVACSGHGTAVSKQQYLEEAQRAPEHQYKKATVSFSISVKASNNITGENENESPIRADLANRYKAMFSDFERTIHERLIKGRERILALNMQKSVMETIDLLQNVLDKRKKTLHTREENLKNNQLSDIESFKDNLVQKYNDAYKEIDEQINIDDQISHVCESAIKNINQELYRCQSLSEIQYFVKNKLEGRCKQTAEKVGEKIKSALTNYSKWSVTACKDFQTKFSTEFRNLAQGVQFSRPEMNALTEVFSNIEPIDVSFDDDAFATLVISGIVTGIIALLSGPLAWILLPIFFFLFGGSLEDKKKRSLG